jgi:hypothetical protein
MPTRPTVAASIAGCRSVAPGDWCATRDCRTDRKLFGNLQRHPDIPFVLNLLREPHLTRVVAELVDSITVCAHYAMEALFRKAAPIRMLAKKVED